MGTTFQFDIEDLEKAFRPMGEQLGAAIGKQLVAFRQQFEAKIEELRKEPVPLREFMTEREVRMECVRLARDHAAVSAPLATDATIIDRADALTQYVLTGKKPEEA